MKCFVWRWAAVVVVLVCSVTRVSAGPAVWPAHLPVYDHVVIVVEENKNYEQVIDPKAAPYIYGTLRAEGANLTQMFGEEHYSEGNYFWLIAGGNMNIGFGDAIPSKENNPAYPFLAPNLGAQLIMKGLSFKGYSEDLPAVGDTVGRKNHYARKHVPWVSFGNIPNGTNVSDSSNLRLVDFPTDFARLPTVSFVIPNLIHDMHDGKSADSIPAGDMWLKKHLDAYYQWAKTHNSLLVITFDEDSNASGYTGVTDPASADKGIRNNIPTLFAGAHIKHGDYAEGRGTTHVNILRTLEAMYKLEKCGAQQPNALKAGIADDALLTDIFEKVP